MIYVYIEKVKFVELTTEDLVKSMNKMIDMMEDDDDIQEVYHNWEMEE